MARHTDVFSILGVITWFLGVLWRAVSHNGRDKYDVDGALEYRTSRLSEKGGRYVPMQLEG